MPKGYDATIRNPSHPLAETAHSLASVPAGDYGLATVNRCATLITNMYDFPLTGAQKSRLRGLGQNLDASLKLGKGGLTPEFLKELQRQLRAQELVKLRFLGADRDERAALCTKVADEGRCICVGAVGHTALFYRQNPEPAERTVTFLDAKTPPPTGAA